MDKRQAERDAWWRAATFVRAAVDGGYDFNEHYGKRDGPKVAAAMADVVAEMERRGHL